MRIFFLLITILFNSLLESAYPQESKILAKSEYMKAEEAYNNGDLNSAIEHLNMSEQLAGPNYLTCYLKVKSLILMQQNAEAVKTIQTYFEVAPNDIKNTPKYIEIQRIYAEQNKLIDDAKKEKERKWTEVKNSIDPGTIYAFFETYPEEDFGNNKLQMINSIEDEYYQTINAYNFNSILKYQLGEYVKYYPNGKYINDANNKLSEISNNLKRKEELKNLIDSKEEELSILDTKEERYKNFQLYGYSIAVAGVLVGCLSLAISDGEDPVGEVTLPLLAVGIGGVVGLIGTTSNKKLRKKKYRIINDLEHFRNEYNELTIVPLIQLNEKHLEVRLVFNF